MDNINKFLNSNACNDLVDIDALKEALMKRYHSNCKGCDAESFFDSFSSFVRKVLSGSVNFDDNEYRDWVNCRIRCFGKYGSTLKNNVDERLFNDIELCESLKNGLNEPIVIRRDGDWLEIDGYHRLVIWQELGNDKIKYIVK